MEIDHKHGHRKRLIQRFLTKSDGLYLYEIIEICLIITIPRKDVSNTAKALYSKYRSFSRICDASPKELAKIPGIGEKSVTFFKLISRLIQVSLKEKIRETTVFKDQTLLQQYCQMKLQNSPTEKNMIMFLNQKGELLEEELIYEGTKNFITTYPREIIKHALNIGADFIVLSHNHPSGNVSPSQNDITTTENIVEMCNGLNLHLYDHYIVSVAQCFSMRSAGYIKDNK